MMREKVTVLIPAFNASKTILRAIHSALLQVDRVIVVNDGSTDNTLALLKDLDNRVQVINFKENKGVGVARQTCLEACQTPYAAWLDSDDIFLPGRINQLSKNLENGYSLVYSSIEVFDGLNNKLIANDIIPDSICKNDGAAFLLGRNLIKGVGVSACNVKHAKEIGFSGLRNCEDMEHLLKTILSGKKIYFDQKTSYRQYKYPNSLTTFSDNEILSAFTMYSHLDKTQALNFIESTSLCDIDKWSIKAYFLSNKNDWAALLKLCTNNDIDNNDQVKWLALFFAGVANFHCNNFDQALLCFQKATQIKRTPDLLNNIAVTLQKLNLAYEEYLHAALESLPQFRNAQKNLTDKAGIINSVPLRIDNYVNTKHPLLQSFL